jgi:hypothetical protein
VYYEGIERILGIVVYGGYHSREEEKRREPWKKGEENIEGKRKTRKERNGPAPGRSRYF